MFMVVGEGKGNKRAATAEQFGGNNRQCRHYFVQWLRSDFTSNRDFGFALDDTGDVVLSLTEAVKTPESQPNKMWRMMHMTRKELAEHRAPTRAQNPPTE